MSTLSLRQLEVIYAILRAGSVTGAASSMNVSQPAISNVLRHTEQQLRFKLFERIGGRLHANPETIRLLPDLDEIFGRIGTLNRTMLELQDGKTGKLLIATSPTLVNAFLPRAIALFRKRNAGVLIAIQSLPTPMVIERVARREVDMGIVYAPVGDSGVEAEILLDTELACVIPKGHPLSRKRAIRVEDLGSQSVISLGATTRIGQVIEETCRKAGVTPPTVDIEASSSLAACLMVSEGIGIGLVDKATSLSGKFTDLVFRSFSPRVPLSVQIIFPRDRPRSMAADRLAKQLMRQTDTAR
jgi:DNA-binding transcriptional LysR family regulator